MSELEKTAPNEIYLIVGDTDKDCNFNELSEVTWADKPIYEETAIKYVKSSQLTIPKSVADELLKFRKSLSDPDTELLGWLTITTALYRYEHFSENFIDWWDELEGKANNLAIAYLNPLTRDLVKVVKG